jgi:hypothetical protein
MRLGLTLTPCRLLFGEVFDTVRLIRRKRVLAVAARPAETVRLFIRHIDQGRFRDAIRLLPDTLIRALGSDRLEAILYNDTAEVRSRGGVTRIDVTRDNWTLLAAEVDVDIHYGDGSVDTEQIALTNQSGEWRIDMMG